MLIVREVFTAKPGQASKLAKLFKKVFSSDPTARVMTDMVGNYNTVVVDDNHRAGHGQRTDRKSVENMERTGTHHKMGNRIARSFL